jgi:hypothetical protein
LLPSALGCALQYLLDTGVTKGPATERQSVGAMFAHFENKRAQRRPRQLLARQNVAEHVPVTGFPSSIGKILELLALKFGVFPVE